MRPMLVLSVVVALLVVALPSSAARADAPNGAYLGQGGTELALAVNALSTTFGPGSAHPDSGLIADFGPVTPPELTLTDRVAVLRFDRPVTAVGASYRRGTVVTEVRATALDPTHWSVDLSGVGAAGAELQVSATGAPTADNATTHTGYVATILPTPPAAGVQRCGDVSIGVTPVAARSIRATGTTCRNARLLAQALLRRSRDARLRGYTCTFQPPTTPQRRSVCRAATRTVTFLVPRT